MPSHVLHCHDLHCSRPLWREGASLVRGVDAGFTEGEFTSVCGPEGCGKNLLLHLLGLLEQPESGEVHLDGINATALPAGERDALRQRGIGILFPSPSLLPSLSVLENIAFPVLKAGGANESEQAAQTLAALQFCGLEGEADRAVDALDPSRRAVVAFARAIIHRPRVLIAECPPAEDLLVPLARRAQKDIPMTVIWSTSDHGAAAAAADRVLHMDHGMLRTP